MTIHVQAWRRSVCSRAVLFGAARRAQRTPCRAASYLVCNKCADPPPRLIQHSDGSIHRTIHTSCRVASQAARLWLEQTRSSSLSASVSSSSVFSLPLLSRCFYGFLSAVASNTSPLSSPLQPLVYVKFRKGGIFPPCAVKWCPAVALDFITVLSFHFFSEGERVISLPFGFTLQLFAGSWNISGTFR